MGFPAGTGIAHTFINDSNAGGEPGEPLVLWIIGHNKVKQGDMVHYPIHSRNRVWPGESNAYIHCTEFNLITDQIVQSTKLASPIFSHSELLN